MESETRTATDRMIMYGTWLLPLGAHDDKWATKAGWNVQTVTTRRRIKPYFEGHLLHVTLGNVDGMWNVPIPLADQDVLCWVYQDYMSKRVLDVFFLDRANDWKHITDEDRIRQIALLALHKRARKRMLSLDKEQPQLA